jgi:hypothetical protein
MKPGVYITVDFECSMGGAWANPALRPAPRQERQYRFHDSHFEPVRHATSLPSPLGPERLHDEPQTPQSGWSSSASGWLVLGTP